MQFRNGIVCVAFVASLLLACVPDADTASDISDTAGEIDGIDTTETAPDTESDDTDPQTGDPADLKLSDLQIDGVPPRKVGEFHREMSARVDTTGDREARGVECTYEIVPLENRTTIDTVSGVVPVSNREFAPGASRRVSVEILMEADSDDENYDARFEIFCTAETEPSNLADDNKATLSSNVLYW
jgi:hypothetical protein